MASSRRGSGGRSIAAPRRGPRAPGSRRRAVEPRRCGPTAAPAAEWQAAPGGPAGLGRKPAHVWLQRRIDEAVYRRRNAMATAKLDHLAGEPGQLEPVAAQQVG